MANLTSSLTIKLIDEVSKPARSVAQALKDAEKAAEAVAKGMGRTAGSDPFRRQLASLKLTANELRDVRREWLLYAHASKQAMGAEWAAKGAAQMRAWERQTIASIPTADEWRRVAALLAEQLLLPMAGYTDKEELAKDGCRFAWLRLPFLGERAAQSR
jgi:hypothetical protein